MNFHRFWPIIIRWGPAVVIMAAIFWLSSTPSRELPDFGGWDLLVKKMGHLVSYAALGVAFLRGVGKQGRGAILQAFALAVLFAVSDELHQSFVPGRNAWWVDVLIDTTGAGFGLFITGRFEGLKRWIFFPA